MSSRRNFLGTAAANAAAFAVLPSSLLANIPSDLMPGRLRDDWDVSWTGRLKAKHVTIFDNAEPESGYGVWRAGAWARQYMEVLKASREDVRPVIVLRHNGIVLAMQQSFWDKYGIGAMKKITHPLTQEPTTRNPVLLDERDGIPDPYNAATLPRQMDRGVVVLACNMALQDCVDLIRKEDKVEAAEARRQAIAYLIPGVILQPSGVFAITLAQEAGAKYLKAS